MTNVKAKCSGQSDYRIDMVKSRDVIIQSVSAYFAGA